MRPTTVLVLGLSVLILIVAAIWFWGVLVGYVEPEGPTGRKDVVQAFALIVAGVVGFIGTIVGIVNVSVSRRTLKQQREQDERRAQDDAMQAYFDQIGNLITEHKLMETTRGTDPIRLVAKAHTLTALERLSTRLVYHTWTWSWGRRRLTPTVFGRVDAERRQKELLLFLYSAGLINKGNRIVSLSGLPLSHGKLSHIHLSEADLSEADLSDSNLSFAKLDGADFSGADLRFANLSFANLGAADLSGADLRAADLSGATVTQEQLDQARSLKGATMPNEE